MNWIWTLLGSLFAAWFRKPDTKQAHDDGVAEGKLQETHTVDAEALENARKYRETQAQVGRLPAQSVASRLHSRWDIPD